MSGKVLRVLRILSGTVVFTAAGLISVLQPLMLEAAPKAIWVLWSCIYIEL